MSQTAGRLEDEVLGLPSLERARLAHLLIASLDAEGVEDPAEVEQSWAEEIERRLTECRSGAAKPISAREVFAEARAAVGDDLDIGS
jgi:putative addiction module component (TIGR02574 family)